MSIAVRDAVVRSNREGELADGRAVFNVQDVHLAGSEDTNHSVLWAVGQGRCDRGVAGKGFDAGCRGAEGRSHRDVSHAGTGAGGRDFHYGRIRHGRWAVGGGWGWNGGWGGWGAFSDDSTTFTSEHPRTILILTVDLADAKANTLVFRGQATVENVSKSESGDEKQTKQCVQKIFKSYPPKPKK